MIVGIAAIVVPIAPAHIDVQALVIVAEGSDLDIVSNAVLHEIVPSYPPAIYKMKYRFYYRVGNVM